MRKNVLDTKDTKDNTEDNDKNVLYTNDTKDNSKDNDNDFFQGAQQGGSRAGEFASNVGRR